MIEYVSVGTDNIVNIFCQACRNEFHWIRYNKLSDDEKRTHSLNHNKIAQLPINNFHNIYSYINTNKLFNNVCRRGIFCNAYLLKCTYPDKCYFNGDVDKISDEKLKNWIKNDYPQMR